MGGEGRVSSPTGALGEAKGEAEGVQLNLGLLVSAQLQVPLSALRGA